jgi:LacI family transcriptional regulator
MVCNSNQSPREEADYLALFAEQRVGGVLLTPADATDRTVEAFQKQRIPFVLVDRGARATRTARCRWTMSPAVRSPCAT